MKGVRFYREFTGGVIAVETDPATRAYERATGLGPFGVAHASHPPLAGDLCAVTFSHSYLDRCTPISEARARQLDPALVAYMEQPE
jgi:hypothetical protein